MALGTTNIRTDLVGATLGTSSRDVGTLCTHSAINRWSKWKPIRSPKIAGLTETDLANATYGLEVLSGRTYSLFRAMTGEEGDIGVGVIYNAPTGGAQSPFRIGDFRNYNHSAVIPFGTGIPSMTPILVKKGSAAIYNYNYLINPVYGTMTMTNSSTYQVGWHELYENLDFSDKVMAVALKNVATSEEVLFTHTHNYTEAGGLVPPQINWNISPIKGWTGNIEVFYFLTNFKCVQGATYTYNTAHRFYGIPMDNANLNPFILNATNQLADNSMVYSFANNLIHDTTGGNVVGGTVTVSSVGSPYTGGSIGTVLIKVYDQNGYTTEIYSKTETSVTLSSEETVNVPVWFNATGNSATFCRIWVGGVLKYEGVVPSGDLATNS